MLGERVFEIWNRLGQTQRNMAELLGFKESTLSKWRTRTDKCPDTKSVEKVARTLFRDCNWLMGDPDAPEWSPRMRKVQGRLRELAYEHDKTELRTTRNRLLFIHKHLLEMLPDMDERLWAWQLRWSVADWNRFVKDESFAPGDTQIAGASEITTIPGRWFVDGDTACLEDLSPDSLRELGRFLRSMGMDEVDAKRVLQKGRTPRL